MGFGTLLGELSAGRPVCAQIAWSGGGDHFIILNGAYLMTFGQEFVYVEDPGFGPALYTYSGLVNDYNGSGTWIGTFGTCTCVPH
jgi:hypothetical protein